MFDAAESSRSAWKVPKSVSGWTLREVFFEQEPLWNCMFDWVLECSGYSPIIRTLPRFDTGGVFEMCWRESPERLETSAVTAVLRKSSSTLACRNAIWSPNITYWGSTILSIWGVYIYIYVNMFLFSNVFPFRDGMVPSPLLSLHVTSHWDFPTSKSRIKEKD